jgi:branched-subunit amino acid transport protein
MSAELWVLIAGCAVVTALIKGVGPVAFGGRELPERLAGVIELMAPALLVALVVTQALADGEHIAIGADTAGVGLAGLVVLRGASIMVAVPVAVIVTAGLRVLG